MKPTELLDKIGIILLATLAICAIMIGITYQELQELEENTHKTKGSKERTIEARLEEMMRKMEKDD